MGTGERFGLRLKALRKERGLTQEALATRIDRSVDALSNIERGRSLPSFETVEKLSRVLSIELKVLFDFDGPSVPRRRAELLEQLSATAQTLSDADLELGLEQLRLLAKRSSPSK